MTLLKYRGLLAVQIRTAVVKIPWEITVNNPARRKVLYFASGEWNPVIGIVNIGAATNQKYKGDHADQRKDRYDLPTLFQYSCHAFGALI